jgi:hypothetical protein
MGTCTAESRVIACSEDETVNVEPPTPKMKTKQTILDAVPKKRRSSGGVINVAGVR